VSAPPGSLASVSDGMSYQWAKQSVTDSEPGEMVLESSLPVVFPKFDMHIYTSILTTNLLKATIMEYYIPTDLHPSLPLSVTRNHFTSLLVTRIQEEKRRKLEEV
ncbi:hypothetical protein Tco_1160594, partial [Tanacetum coccineum]